jgi:DNA polymerase III delta prime subunit
MTGNLFNLAAGSAIIGVIASFWGHLKAVVWKFVSLFIQRVEIRTTGYLTPVLIGYLIQHYRRSRIYDRAYGAMPEYIRTQERYGIVSYEEFGENSLIFWNGWLPFIFTQGGRAGSSQGQSGGNFPNQSNDKTTYISLTFIRGTLDVEAIITGAAVERNNMNWSNEQLSSEEQRRFYIKYVPDFNRGRNSAANPSSNTSLPWYQEGKFRLLDYRPEQLGRGRSEKHSALDNLIFPDRIKRLIQEIKLWRVNRNWYHKRGIPWKRGWLLYGPPGTGKTALVRAFAEDLDMPIWVFNLNELSNFEFMKHWIEMQSAAPCIALVEDIDNVFHGRRKVGGLRSYMAMYHQAQAGPGHSTDIFGDGANEPSSKQGVRNSGDNVDDGIGRMCDFLSFDIFLNMLDGVERNDGIFTIITTNNLDAIDEALGKPREHEDGSVDFISTRPGRIDKAIELTYMTRRDKIRMAQRILGDYPTAMQQIIVHLNINATLQETPAQFQERCAQLALQAFWQEQGGVLLNGNDKLDTQYRETTVELLSKKDWLGLFPVSTDVLTRVIGEQAEEPVPIVNEPPFEKKELRNPNWARFPSGIHNVGHSNGHS